MKRVNKTLAALLMSGLLATAFTACGTENKKKNADAEAVEMHDNHEGMHEGHADMQGEQHMDEKHMEEQTAAIEFKDEATAEVFKAYIALKDAFVATDAAKASEASGTLAEKAGENAELKSAAEAIANANDIEAQRKDFVTVTDAVAEMLNGSLASGEVYKQYCPMAFNNTGAAWISAEKEIMNPYFGDKMLHCGSVKETIK
ncbi:DUF3347 domain-containing protein [Robertkochia marina]|uniref:DUF3347 domain-containing protein n=1 Tax=Robertkochia marina TaxID=1227945 RepID=A0A4S3M0G5_9FLAO|nr:DUF3347 domain-containing protein [Robertkochia marina]THD66497.1 DUF3347 domain-containing protein [Robertkochia marina]TRZ45664.1 DUF3347 domain-containing protein [Robertkochia marina]